LANKDSDEVQMTEQLLVIQLRFARSELLRCLVGVEDQEARKRFDPMNCISWIVGHLADQENRYWVRFAQGIELMPDLREKVGYGRPPSTPALDEMWDSWRLITNHADNFLDSLTDDSFSTYLQIRGKPIREDIGTMLLRNIYHYWFHIGEAYAIRQLLGHRDLPDFVGDMSEARYF
jgi:hypothetical protein